MSRFRMLINGRLVEGARSTPVVNPGTGESFEQCPLADEPLLEEAVAAAKAAFPLWSKKPMVERADLIRLLAEMIEENSEELTKLLTAEQGKPLDQAAFEISGSAHILREFAGMTLSPRIIRDGAAGKVFEIRCPLGVVAAITPWNFPVILLMNKVGPALLAGNTIVIKPAPTTPLTTLVFGEFCQKVLPAGVINVICDANDLGGKLAAHPDVAKIAFTGSTATGKKVLAAAAGSVKRVTLELGGNDAAIVLDDAHLLRTAKNVFDGAMINAGQVCVAIKRAYVPSSMYDSFCDELARLAREAVVDEGSKQGAQIGPVQNQTQFEKLKELLDDTRLQGTVIAGGAAIDRPGFFIAPTIVRDVPDDARIVREEQFGPILPVLKYDSIEDALLRANDSNYGLAGTVWSSDTARATEVATRMETGTVWINQLMAIDPAIPFRGTKQSGLGTELGEEGLLEYTKSTVINIAPET